MSNFQYYEAGNPNNLTRDLVAEDPSDRDTGVLRKRYEEAVRVLGASCTRIQQFESPGEGPGRASHADTFIWPPQEGLEMKPAKADAPGARVRRAAYDKNLVQARVMVAFENKDPAFSSVRTVMEGGKSLPSELRATVDGVTKK